MAAVATPEKQEVRAEAKWVRISARKARLVTEHIRGRSVPEARTVLAFTPRAAARFRGARFGFSSAPSGVGATWTTGEGETFTVM